jgi:hypothetical protein
MPITPYTNPNQTLFTPHSYNQFFMDNHDLISLPSSLHIKLYDYIIQSKPPANFEFTKITFSFLPNTLITETLWCTHPLIGYIQPPQNIIHPFPRTNNIEYTSHTTHFTTWNISSLNTSLPCLQSFLDHHTPTIIILQETKLTSKKSSKYLQRIFFQYKLLFNNTSTTTQYNQQPGVPYMPSRGGLPILVHNKYAYPNNITKIPTILDISPYF